jgi:hypothetical protein
MIENSKKYSIYTLPLENQKYYVGRSITTNKKQRVRQHSSSTNSTIFTKKFKPIGEPTFYDNCDPYDEDKYLFKMMNTYGIENVRGGSFPYLNLSDQDKYFIERSIIGATDKCFNCGSSSHFVRECPYTKKEKKFRETKTKTKSQESQTKSQETQTKSQETQTKSQEIQTKSQETQTQTEENSNQLLDWIYYNVKNVKNIVNNIIF